MITTRMALGIWLTAAAAYGQEIGQKITVCLNFATTDRLVIKAMAKELATRMFADAGISVEWTSRETVHGNVRPPIVVQAVIGASPDFMPDALAYAELAEGGRITVFLDRVERRDYPGIVLAHVLVHEITHMAQGINRHSATGVMKARWTGRDYSEMRLHPLRFEPEDLELIHQGLSNPQN